MLLLNVILVLIVSVILRLFGFFDSLTKKLMKKTFFWISKKQKNEY